jgi:hypothetical protein
MESKKEQRKERREERRAERVERRRRTEQEDYSWDLGELEPAVVTSEIPARDGGSIDAATVTAQGGPRSIKGKAAVQNPSSGIINRQKPTQAYGGMIEPAVVTAERTQDGGSISASEVAAKGKTMPNLQGKAVVQNPSQMEIRYDKPVIPQYGGSLDASSAQAERKSMPSLQGRAEVQNPSYIGNMPNPPQYGGQLPTSGVRAEGRAMPNIQGKATAMNPSDIGRMPNSPQYGGEIAASEASSERKRINEPKAQAEALTKAGISQKRYEPTYVSDEPELEQLDNIQSKAEQGNPSDIGKMPTPTSGSSEKQEVEKKGDEEGSAEVDGGELSAARVYGERKTMPTLQAKAEAMTKAGISQKRYQPNQLPEDSDEEPAISPTTETTPVSANTGTNPTPSATPSVTPTPTAQPKNEELDALGASHQNQMDALRNYNQQRYNNLGEIISAANAKMKEAQQKDEKARKRENAFRYISGLGDTLSSVANLVGTANDASHQQQKYNSHEVVRKAEEARKARKLEMDDLSKRLDEMKTRQMELKAAGSLKEAELKVAQDKEKAKLLADQRKAEEEKRRFDENLAYRKERDKVEDAQRDRTFNAQQEQIKQTQQNWQKTYDLQLRKFNEEQKGNKYNFTFSDGSFDIPKEKINDANIERIYQMLPEEVRKTVKGEQFIEYGTDEFGTQTRTTAHKAPSLTQKLAAIASYADNDNAIKNELRALSGMKRTQSAQTTPPQQNPNNPGTAGTQKKTITGW